MKQPSALPPPTAARSVFGAQLPLAERYADILVGAGVERGLVGPRESGRIWDRHLLNCAIVAESVPPASLVYDVGSGAGLPGLALAIARPDLDVVLVEPLERRVAFLEETVTVLGLARVRVLRARAEQLDPPGADVVTARAVAPLSRLAGWCLPLVRPGGVLLALKGGRAADELHAAEPELRRLGATTWTIDAMGLDVLEEVTTVVRIVAGAPSIAPMPIVHRAAQRPAAAPGRRVAKGRR